MSSSLHSNLRYEIHNNMKIESTDNKILYYPIDILIEKCEYFKLIMEECKNDKCKKEETNEIKLPFKASSINNFLIYLSNPTDFLIQLYPEMDELASILNKNKKNEDFKLNMEDPECSKYYDIINIFYDQIHEFCFDVASLADFLLYNCDENNIYEFLNYMKNFYYFGFDAYFDACKITIKTKDGYRYRWPLIIQYIKNVRSDANKRNNNFNTFSRYYLNHRLFRFNKNKKVWWKNTC